VVIEDPGSHHICLKEKSALRSFHQESSFSLSRHLETTAPFALKKTVMTPEMKILFIPTNANLISDQCFISSQLPHGQKIIAKQVSHCCKMILLFLIEKFQFARTKTLHFLCSVKLRFHVQIESLISIASA